MLETTIQVKGLRELSQALEQLPERLAGRALGASVKAGADIIRDQARERVPIDTGLTKKAIVSYRKKGSTPLNITYEVAVTMKKRGHRAKKTGRSFNKKTGKWGVMWPPFYWRFVEFGTVKMAAKPFMRPAFDYKAGEALAMIKGMLAKAVEVAAAQVPKYRGNG